MLLIQGVPSSSGENWTASTRIGQVLVQFDSVAAAQAVKPPTERAWCVVSGVEGSVTTLLDQGWERVVLTRVSASTLQTITSELDEQVCRDRLGVRLDVDAALKALASLTVGVVLIETPSVAACTATESWQRLVAAASKQSIRLVIVPITSPEKTTPQQIASLDATSVDVVLPLTAVTISKEPNKLDLATALWSMLSSDRADHLVTTVVADVYGQTLGLVYSSEESIRESLRTGTGVYQSRKRGLWYKGASSGDTQRLVRIETDCDRDALCFIVVQEGRGFCHLGTATCFGQQGGLVGLERVLKSRYANAPPGSYTQRLFKDPALLSAKIREEAQELCDASSPEDIAWEAADLIYFALVKCTAAGVSLQDIERQLDARARKVTRRPGNAKPAFVTPAPKATPAPAKPAVETSFTSLSMQQYVLEELNDAQRKALLQRPITSSDDILAKVKPIMNDVRQRGDKALIELTEKFDRVRLDSVVIRAPFPKDQLDLVDPQTRAAIDAAYENIYKFHAAQLKSQALRVETMPGVVCSRFARPIERVGLYVPGGTAVLPSTALMLGVPAKVAGCHDIVIASPPRKDGTCVPEVLYVADKVGASTIVLAGGAQAVAAMAYGTESVPKVDKICGPGNQFVTAAKMVAQNDSSCMVSIDMPAGPSELLVIADKTSNPAYVVADLLSQAEHGPDSQVVLITVNMSDKEVAAIDRELLAQAARLPRREIVWQSIPKSFRLAVRTMEEALTFSNRYAPEHLILHVDGAEKYLDKVLNAGSVFVGPYSPESCGDYASGTNHTLPTYGYARMYSGVNTDTFLKHITSQQLTAEGLDRLGDTVMRLAEIEGLEAHRNAVAVRIKDIRGKKA